MLRDAGSNQMKERALFWIALAYLFPLAASAQFDTLSGVWVLRNKSDWMEDISPYPDTLYFARSPKDTIDYPEFGMKVTNYVCKVKNRNTLQLRYTVLHRDNNYANTGSVGYGKLKLLSYQEGSLVIKSRHRRKYQLTRPSRNGWGYFRRL